MKSAAEFHGTVDIGIITVRPDEYTALLDQFPDRESINGRKFYEICRCPVDGRGEAKIAIVRCLEQAQGSAQEYATALIEDFNPDWLLVVGIAGGVPDDDFSLGDVLLASRIYDMSVYAAIAGDHQSHREWAPSGGSVHPAVEKILSALPGWEAKFKGWNSEVSIRGRKPVCAVPDDLQNSHKFYGSQAHREKAYRSLKRHFPDDGTTKQPVVAIAPVATANALVKDDELLREWKAAARSFGFIEMEAGGVYRAARRHDGEIPVLIIRGLSDIVGFGRQSEWTDYARLTAAAFTAAFVRSGIWREAWPRRSDSLPLSRFGPGPDDGYGGGGTAISQQVRLGDVTGGINTINILQQQGASAEEIVRLVQSTSSDVNAQIDLAVEHIKAGRTDVAIHVLTELRRRSWGRMTGFERYRLIANIGVAFEGKGDPSAAARHYIEAKGHAPLEERARAFESVGHFLLGDNKKAYGLAVGVLADHQTSTLAAAVVARAAPADMPFEDIEKSLPAGVRDHVEVLHALAWRAIQSGDVVTAEKLARKGLEQSPDSKEIQALLGSIIVQAESREAVQVRRPDGARLEEAISTLSRALDKHQGKQDLARLRYTRGEALALAGRPEEAETDFRAAIEAMPTDPHFPFRFALFLDKRGRYDSAIDILKKTINLADDPNNRLLLANLLADRNALGDRDGAVTLLEALVTQPAEGDPPTRAGIAATLCRILASQKRHDDAVRVADSLPEGYVSDVVRLTLSALCGLTAISSTSAKE
jgi:nucleoside phosphorylase/tetratricopeptide (TPR) repeat protein